MYASPSDWRICYVLCVLVLLQLLMALFGKYEFMPSDALVKWFAANFCDHAVEDLVCESIIFLFAGVDVSNMNAVSTLLHRHLE
jgi:hypothetical protein